jgi:hypothetical protein
MSVKWLFNCRNHDLKLDIYYHMNRIVEQRGNPEMTESLRLIIEDMIAGLRS